MPESQQKTVFDTGQQQLGAVYAKALLAAAEKAGNTETVVEELESLVADVLVKVPQLETTVASPRVPLEVKEGVLDRGFRGQLSDLLLNFLKVLARRGRFDCLRAIAQAAREQFNVLRGRVEVHVRSAEPLDAAARDLVTSQLRASLGREVYLRTDVDPDLIGGLVVRIGDTVYDGSVADRLSRLKEEMMATASERIRGELHRFAVAE